MTRSRPRSVVVTEMALAAIAIAASICCALLQLIEPFSGWRLFTFLGTWVAVGFVVHRLVAIVQRRIAGKGWRHLVGALKWCLAIVAPTLVTAPIESSVVQRQLEIARSTLQAAQRGVQDHHASTGEYPSSVEPFLVDGGPLRFVEYEADAKQFRLRTTAPTIDIDGRSIGYDSATDSWWHRHHDVEAGVPEGNFDRSETCFRRDGPWDCTQQVIQPPRSDATTG